MVDRRRELGDALGRGSHQVPLRRNSGQISRKSSSFAQSSKCFLANGFSKLRHRASAFANRDRDHRRHLDPTTMLGPLEQAIESKRSDSVCRSITTPTRIRAIGRSTRQTRARYIGREADGSVMRGRS